MTKGNLGREGFMWLTLSYITPHHYQKKSGQELKQGGNLEVGTDAEVMEECVFLAGSLWLAPAFFL